VQEPRIHAAWNFVSNFKLGIFRIFVIITTFANFAKNNEFRTIRTVEQ